MGSRSLAGLLFMLAFGGCQSFSAVCREAAGGAGCSAVAPPVWAESGLADLGWESGGTRYWYFVGTY